MVPYTRTRGCTHARFMISGPEVHLSGGSHFRECPFTDHFVKSCFHLNNINFINPASIYSRFVLSIQLLVNKEFFHQSSFYLGKNCHQSSFLLTRNSFINPASI